MNKRYLLLILLLAASATLSAQNRPVNRGAGSPIEVLNAYDALEFMGMPYRFLLPENYDSACKNASREQLEVPGNLYLIVEFVDVIFE